MEENRNGRMVGAGGEGETITEGACQSHVVTCAFVLVCSLAVALRPLSVVFMFCVCIESHP